MSSIYNQTNAIYPNNSSIKTNKKEAISGQSRLESHKKVTQQYIEQMIANGASKRGQLTTAKKISEAAGFIICCIGMGMEITAAILFGHNVITGFDAIGAGFSSMLLGCLGLWVLVCGKNNGYEIVREDQICRFWTDLTGLTFTELRKQDSRFSISSHFAGIRYHDLVVYGVLTKELSHDMQTIFVESMSAEREKASALIAIENLRLMPEQEKTINIQRINTEHDARQRELEERFNSLRNQLL